MSLSSLDNVCCFAPGFFGPYRELLLAITFFFVLLSKREGNKDFQATGANYSGFVIVPAS